MLRPVTIRTVGTSVEHPLPEGGQRRRRRALYADARGREVADRTRDGALGTMVMGVPETAHLLDGERDGHAHGHAVGEGRAAVASPPDARPPR